MKYISAPILPLRPQIHYSVLIQCIQFLAVRVGLTPVQEHCQVVQVPTTGA